MTRRGSQSLEKYVQVRIHQLNDELAKTNMEETVLILSKAIYELSIVLDMIQRQGDAA